MAQTFPYTYISCPCSDVSRRTLNSTRIPRDAEPDDELQEEEKSFDSRNPRSSFSLFPSEHLLYCEECHDIKCPRCVTEEIICSYCPSCLFEVPSSSVKQDYNRCARNCFCCPICTSQLITASIGDRSEGPWVLSCSYCMWSSLDAGIKFDKPQSLRSQVDRTANGGKPQQVYRDFSKDLVRNALGKTLDRHGTKAPPSYNRTTSSETLEKDIGHTDVETPQRPHARFEALRAFYKDQLLSSGESGTTSAFMDYSSPSSLSRIMSLYANTSSSVFKKTTQRSTSMRETSSPSEGLLVLPSSHSRSRQIDYIDAPSAKQLAFQHPHPIGNPSATHLSDLRPMPTLLRTKRSKRCAQCKHILVKPEFKVTSTRFRIKLIALNYIPFMTLKPVPTPNGPRAPGPDGADITLDPGKPSQWILTLRNPLFDAVSVSLGTPSLIPGKYNHKVTILCPEFSIGKNGDVWDDAINNPVSSSASFTTSSKSAVTNLINAGSATTTNRDEQIAGKPYEIGRNYTSIVLEIVPSSIVSASPQLDEDEDVVEIPIRVRLEWTPSDEPADSLGKKSDKAFVGDGVDRNGDTGVDDGRRELAYWCVLGIGRVRC